MAALAALALTVVGSGCAHGTSQRDGRQSVSMENGAVVLSGAALLDGNGTVLDAMSGKVPNFRVRHASDPCPVIALRSAGSVRSVTAPQVYVDGARSSDTCILESLSSRDVERVEVYPLGFTTRPGYAPHSHGLILVFMRSS